MDTIVTALLAIIASAVSLLFYKAWKTNQYFKERGVPHVKPLLFFGNSAAVLFMKKYPGELQEDICNQFPDEPVVGLYDFMKPVYMIRDADMVEKVLIKDFVHFVDHGFPIDEKRNPLDSNLFTMSGKRWKALRNKLSPIFTTGKLKMMFESVKDCSVELTKQLEHVEEVEMRDVLGRYAMDVIGSCAFGLEPKNLAKPNSKFHEIGKRAFKMDWFTFLSFILAANFPILAKILRTSFSRPEVTEYYGKIVRDTMQYRREHNYTRNDFLQLMMQLQDKGYVEIHTKDPDDDYLGIDQSVSTEKFELTTDQLTGNAITFLTAGFEGTTLSMMYTLYELSKNRGIQERVRAEVFKEVTKQAGSLNYDALNSMHYLEQCVKETLRKYFLVQGLFRGCTKDYTFPNGVKMKVGEQLLVSIKALHYNQKYYPEPEKFIPERFGPDNSIPSCAWVPFGNGPRICIAMRFAMMEIKHCIAELLMKYNFEISPKTKEPLTVSIRSFFTSPNEKIIFDVTKLKA